MEEGWAMAIAGKKEASKVVDSVLHLLCRGDDKAEQWHIALWQRAYNCMGLRARAELGDYNGTPTVRVSGPDMVLAFNFTVLVTAHYCLDSTHEHMEMMVRRFIEEYRRV